MTGLCDLLATIMSRIIKANKYQVPEATGALRNAYGQRGLRVTRPSFLA